MSPILGAGEMMTPNGRCHPPHTQSPTKHFIWPNYIECSQSLKHGDCPYSLSKVGKSRYLAKLHRAEPGVSPLKSAFQVRKGSQEIKIDLVSMFLFYFLVQCFHCEMKCSHHTMLLYDVKLLFFPFVLMSTTGC